ncbi:dipeptidyl peptidase 2-like [Gigantopelta aegis]|uniref:dipeptidyl peptidase 2-like n=1 Tax=Gigantopelta aegis TaxID=1735272 RepID=UPI001B88DA2E|nr:dipeptidyl peptidase 2-like [Gigantopelta aegis]
MDTYHQNDVLLFYSGNEGPIESFYENTGFIFELAKELQALVVFGEHRYYGDSLPYGPNKTFEPTVNMRYLNVEQALADYAVLVQEIKTMFHIKKAIVIGGSYGGLLAAWSRFKYPNIFDGALAASAPFYVTAKMILPTAFFGKVTKVDHLKGWVRNSFTSLAMVDYPYPASFLAPLPAYPVKLACGILFIDCADPTGCGTGLASLSWDYQACTEMNLVCTTNNVTDMFPPSTYDVTDYCYSRWGIPKDRRNEDWIALNYWAQDMSAGSNIIFSNGDLDPWSVGGILRDLSETLTAIVISGGAHHLDLRASDPRDPPSVTEARREETAIIKKWISEQ